MPTGNMVPPADTAYTGPRIATRPRTEDSVTKHWQRWQVEDPRVYTGFYYGVTGRITMPTTAQTAPAAMAWFINPVGSSVKVAINRIDVLMYQQATSISSAAPRMLLERITFTGSSSAGAITEAQRRSSDNANVAHLLTASTGLTITTGDGICAWLPPVQLTTGAAAHRMASQPIWNDRWNPPHTEQPVLDAGEGIALRMPDTGGGTRELLFSVRWAEFSLEL